MVARARPPSPFTIGARAKSSFAVEIGERLSSLPDLELRAMFGGHGVYAEGTMFAIVWKGELYLKVDERSRRELLAMGSTPFTPGVGRVLASYYRAPGEVLEDYHALLHWAERARLATELSARARRPKPGPARSAKPRRGPARS